MTVKINETEIIIRPSSVDTFFQCSWQWAKVFLEGKITIPNSRAAIGTGVHKGIETMWEESMAHNKKDVNIDVMMDAGIESFNEEAKKGMRYDDGETVNSCHAEIKRGLRAYAKDATPFLDIPKAVEQRFTVPIKDHPLVSAVSGTVDYLTENRIDDVKTSKRKPTVANYRTQQSIYKFLAVENGVNVQHSMIQSVVFTKDVQTSILSADINVDQAKVMVNNMLSTLRAAAEDVAPMEVLFRPNPKYYLCSEKYCTLYGTAECPATKRGV